jgi:hypothetical protein
MFPYRELVGSLMYLAVCTRPDISQAVGALARYMSAVQKQHWYAARDVLRYVGGTTGVGICFGDALGLHGYCDACCAGGLEYPHVYHWTCFYFAWVCYLFVQSLAANCCRVLRVLWLLHLL